MNQLPECNISIPLDQYRQTQDYYRQSDTDDYDDYNQYRNVASLIGGDCWGLAITDVRGNRTVKLNSIYARSGLGLTRQQQEEIYPEQIEFRRLCYDSAESLRNTMMQYQVKKLEIYMFGDLTQKITVNFTPDFRISDHQVDVSLNYARHPWPFENMPVLAAYRNQND